MVKKKTYCCKKFEEEATGDQAFAGGGLGYPEGPDAQLEQLEDGTPGVLAFRVVPDLPHLLGTPAGDGDLASPRQRLLA
jgi:hypothetical protein